MGPLRRQKDRVRPSLVMVLFFVKVVSSSTSSTASLKAPITQPESRLTPPPPPPPRRVATKPETQATKRPPPPPLPPRKAASAGVSSGDGSTSDASENRAGGQVEAKSGELPPKKKEVERHPSATKDNYTSEVKIPIAATSYHSSTLRDGHGAHEPTLLSAPSGLESRNLEKGPDRKDTAQFTSTVIRLPPPPPPPRKAASAGSKAHTNKPQPSIEDLRRLTKGENVMDNNTGSKVTKEPPRVKPPLVDGDKRGEQKLSTDFDQKQQSMLDVQGKRNNSPPSKKPSSVQLDSQVEALFGKTASLSMPDGLDDSKKVASPPEMGTVSDSGDTLEQKKRPTIAEKDETIEDRETQAGHSTMQFSKKSKESKKGQVAQYATDLERPKALPLQPPVRTVPAPPLTKQEKQPPMPNQPLSNSLTHEGQFLQPLRENVQPYPQRQQRVRQQHAQQYPNQYKGPNQYTTTPTFGSQQQRSQNRQPYPIQQRTPRTDNNNPNRPTPSSTVGAPVLQSLWSRVEKGMDGLANFEDAITGRAQQLVSTAVPRSFRQQRQTKQEPRRPGPVKRQAKQDFTTQSLSSPQLRWRQQQQQQQSTRRDDSVSPQPIVALHQFNASSSIEGNSKKSEASSDPAKSVPQNCRNDPLSAKARKLVPVNGGASSPNDNGGWDYPGQNRYSSMPPPNQTSPTQPSPSDASPNTDTTAESGAIQPGSDSANMQGGPVVQRPSSTIRQQGSAPNSQQMRPPFAQSAQGGPNSASIQQPGQRRNANWQQGQTMSRGPLPSVGSTTHKASGTARGVRPVAATPVSRSPIYTDDDDSPSFVAKLLGSVPIPSIGKLFRRRKHTGYAGFDVWDAQDEEAKQSRGFFGLFRRRQESASAVPGIVSRRKQTASTQGVIAKPLQSLMERSKNGKSSTLLTSDDKKRIRGIGKSRAILDVIALCFLLVGVRQLEGLENVPFPTTVAELGTVTVPNLLSSLIASVDTWAPLAFAATILTVYTNSLLYKSRVQRKATDVATAAEAEASYGRLFVRLVMSAPTPRDLPEKLFQAARLQVMALADLSRLRSFVTYTVSIILLMTVTFIKPLLLTTIGSFIHIVTLPDWRRWPIPTELIWANIKDTVGGVGREFKALMEVELKGAGHHPMQVAFKASILASLVAVAFLPLLEQVRATEASSDGEEEDSRETVQQMTERISNLGASSAQRLSILSKNGWAENAIERWSLLKDESSATEGDVSVGSLLRRCGYYFASWFVLALPILLFGFLLDTPMTGWSSAQMPRWESLVEISVLLLFTNGLLWKTIGNVVESTSSRADVLSFLELVAEGACEKVKRSTSPQPFASSANPTAGLLVKDLWAAHIVKRAWAIRAAHLTCRNGEVLVILGDDGAGKSRLLTTIAESIVSPPRGALTARIQRGSVALGGIDVTKWDSNQLRKRVGLLLSDVNSMSNMAGLWSGLSLEEILEPGDGLKLADPTHTSSAIEKSCMIRALKVTGLYWSLLPRLPTKLSTVLTANEEDLRPSPIRPRYHVLSPTEWSKLMLAKLLAQAMYDNENSAGSSDKVDNSLVGSLFLLDDATLLLSETDEAKLLRDLRRTGVATVLSSNKWATGRLADRIVVMQDGTIVESGTHIELLSRGPQQSIYAAKWHAMTAS